MILLQPAKFYSGMLGLKTRIFVFYLCVVVMGAGSRQSSLKNTPEAQKYLNENAKEVTVPSGIPTMRVSLHTQQLFLKS